MSKYIPGNPTVSGPQDYTAPLFAASAGTGTVYNGTWLTVRVNGQKQLMTAAQIDQLIAQGTDFEIVTPGSNSEGT